jgi:hypothetical protein
VLMFYFCGVLHIFIHFQLWQDVQQKKSLSAPRIDQLPHFYLQIWYVLYVVLLLCKRDRERDVSCFRMSTIYAYICISAIYMYISRLFIFRNKYSMSFPRCDQGQRLTKGLQWNRQVQWSLVPSPRVFRRYDRWHACLPGALYRDICCLIRISIHHHDRVCVCVCIMLFD